MTSLELSKKIMETIKIISYALGSFILGSIMFSVLIPKIFLKKDVCAESSDHNPGSSSVFATCSVPLGLLCLFLDILKGFIPVFIAMRIFDIHNYLFALIIIAPVAGHAFAPLNHFNGGKAIAPTFGIAFALIPESYIGLLLAAIYILFSTLIKIYPIRRRSIITFALFGILSAIFLIFTQRYVLAIGLFVSAAIVAIKHLKWFCVVNDKPKNVETETV